jgi:hypothetical protein
VEIETNSRVPTMPSMVQPITKPISPLRGGIGLEFMPLLVQTFNIHVIVTTIVRQPMEGSERSNRKQDEPINFTYIILDNRLEYLEFLSTNVS